MRLNPEHVPAADIISELCEWIASRPNDNLDVSPFMVIRKGAHTLPSVQIRLGLRKLFISTDSARRALPQLEAVRRLGAAEDLLRACDEAETIAAQIDAGARERREAQS